MFFGCKCCFDIWFFIVDVFVLVDDCVLVFSEELEDVYWVVFFDVKMFDLLIVMYFVLEELLWV